jgi:hypothetical protein
MSVAEQEMWKEPARIWTSSMEQLLVVKNFDEHKYAIGDNVFMAGKETHRMLEREGVPVEADYLDNVLQITGCESAVEVLWQDGCRTLHKSIELEQPMTIEDHQVWCGEHVIYRNLEGVEKDAIVQTMDSNEQTAVILLHDDQGKSRIVSILECKSEGSPDFPYGINRGDVVLISSTSTGYTPPAVQMLGRSENDLDEDAVIDMEGDMILMGKKLAESSSSQGLSKQIQTESPGESSEIDWYGIVIDCLLDGHTLVRLPNGRCVQETTANLTRLVDDWDDVIASDDGEEGSEDLCEDEGEHRDCACMQCDPWVTSDGHLIDEDNDAEMEWEDAEDSSDGNSVDQDSKVDQTASGVEGKCESAASLPLESDSKVDTPAPPHNVNKFKVLEQAPRDHKFIDSVHPLSNQRKFLSRVRQEYSILSTSLPGEYRISTNQAAPKTIRRPGTSLSL